MKRRMRHTYEIHAILTAIYCINETTVQDKDIANLIDYALYRVYKDGAGKLKQKCKGKSKKDVMPELRMLLQSETDFEPAS